MEAITAGQMAEIEKKTEAFGIPLHILMENAGAAVARFVIEKFGPGKKVAVVCGTGNNGGDGFVAARHLANLGDDVKVFLVGDENKITKKEALLNWNVTKKLFRVETDLELKNFDVIIDAILGTGVAGELREPVSSAIDRINASRAVKVAVDVPSGIDPTTGKFMKAVRANYTITFHKMKTGLLNAKEMAGKIIVADIGIPMNLLVP